MIANPKLSVHRDWDAIEPESLLQLVSVRKTTDRFGKLLRHYWLPNTVLTYESTVERRMPDGSRTVQHHDIMRRLFHCDADSCTWRERVKEGEERFCTYNRSEQTFRTQPILGYAAQPLDINEARIQAFLNIPVLTPLLPIPMGFRWHVESDNGFMEFVLESEIMVDEMPVILVRRHGGFWGEADFGEGKTKIKFRREGVTAHAIERSVVLRDIVRDTVVEAEDRRLLGLETTSRLNLVRSELPDIQTAAPLYFQYRTSGGQKYLYDVGTGRIIRVNLADFETILDDYHRLHPLEIYAKHPEIAPENITASLLEIERHREGGQLVDHQPRELCTIDKVVYNKEIQDVGEFWKSNGTLLVLGITERCNLDCAYCCFSGKFAGQRTHANRSMRFETAKKAIADFLDQKSTNTNDLYLLSFYGGEPLLEFDLLKNCVEFAKGRAKESGKQASFSVTTNGTLLDDAAVDFLVENEFLILISLDGPQESHDRYRVFPNGKGSFETVDANLKRFAQRYPDYGNRGLNFTLAPPLDLDATEKLFEEMISDFPISRVAMVNTGLVMPDGFSPTTRYGCRSTCAKSEIPLEAFQAYRHEDWEKLQPFETECVENLALCGSMEARSRKPFSLHLFEGQIEARHKRPVQKKPPERLMYVPCLPGFTRRFCDAAGNYRVCERVDDSQAFMLGNVWNGLDTEKLERTLELRRHMGDCANCTSLKTCDLCYARIPNSDGSNAGFDPAFDRLCQKTRENDRRMFALYTGIMERNPKAFERPDSSNPPGGKPFYYATRINRQEDAVEDKLRCEKQF